ncbi:superoxide dismutase family protein [Pseudohoeflea coraliihabitans]|uniref:Superoxide dismutase family protein n=1 Tax=Pseudohoeflea coraliihabitans TaxID=2860393 RepID=A0ABS6WIV1_9HYPH|nr:superoxide dismutase family protein [Pseudohoeflea sp. DP4N28-3]MBW3095720.1 superoxide dismutase family protein [Pseudohoeflea sp. DP4N28-3]
MMTCFAPQPRSFILAGFLVGALVSGAQAQDTMTARGTFEGQATGTVELAQTASGQLHLTAVLQGLPQGVHGFHIHEKGDCSSSDFKSAGGHLAGDKAHGVMAEDGPHPGDFPNIHVSTDGVANIEYFSSGLSWEMLHDQDGSAVVVHEGADDYSSQPSGDAGSRLACAVLKADN